jgi:hypothetical protein
VSTSEAASLLSCPHCHFAFHPKAASMTLDYCPRCLARRHVAQPLYVRGVPEDELVGSGSPAAART